MKCIYCLKTKTPNCFKNREHVIPELLGKFKNNFILNEKNGNKAVCDDCNSYFGKCLELPLGRNSIEGLLRYKLGVKKAKEFKFLKDGRIKIKLSEGEFKGAYVYYRYNEKNGSIGIDLPNQVGYKRKDTSEWEFFKLDELKTRKELEEEGFITEGRGATKIMFENLDKLEQIKEILKTKGFELRGYSKPFFAKQSKGDLRTQIESVIDKTILRAIAKIAFNYLTYTQGVKLALNESFNGIRDYIRSGVDNGFRYVLMERKPILEEEIRLSRKITEGHIITLSWNRSKTIIISKVGIFNTTIYNVIFCKFFSGIYRPITIGHHFDIKTKEIKEVTGIDKSFYIP